MARNETVKNARPSTSPHHVSAKERIEKSHEIRKATTAPVRRPSRFSHSAMGNR